MYKIAIIIKITCFFLSFTFPVTIFLLLSTLHSFGSKSGSKYLIITYKPKSYITDILGSLSVNGWHVNAVTVVL